MPALVDPLGKIGRPVVAGLNHIGGIWHLFALTLYYSFIGPFNGRTKLRGQLVPMMSNVGVRSLPIVCLISSLIGATLVLQTGPVLRDYGQLQQLPGVIALSMCREFGPVMTAIVLTARVGASFTAVLASMKINDEIMALETMAIHPVGYLVAPRFLSMIVMLPCLTVLSYLLGMVGGALIAYQSFDISAREYVDGTVALLKMSDVWSGLLKSVVFAALVSMICCYYGFITEGGPMGLGRNTMVAVVTSLVVIIVADTVLSGLSLNYFY